MSLRLFCCLYFILFMCMCMGLQLLQRPEGAPDPLELELQLVMSLLTWVKRTKLRSASALNYEAVFPVHNFKGSML